MTDRSACWSLLFCLALLLAPFDSPRAEMNRPILRLSWQTENGQQHQRSLTLADLQAMPQVSLRLQLPPALGIEGEYDWQGVSLRQLVASSGYHPNQLTLTALNDYSVNVPAQDLQRFDPLLAYGRDGQPISVRDKGPLILIYPFQQFAELNQQVYLNRTIWQINEIHLR